MVVAYTQKQISPKIWLTFAGASVAGALAALVVLKSREAECTAINASGQRVVIGTVLTDRGARYKLDNPTDDNNMILEALGALSPDLAWTKESIERCRKALALPEALWIPLFGVAAVAATSVSGIGGSQRVIKPVRHKPRVFVSYNHEDSASALDLEQFLQKHDIEVILDKDSMMPGERIADFIQRSIRDCDAVVSLISTRSLLSAWVASETIGTLSRNKWGQDVTFIACYLDDRWFEPQFRLQCTQQIDERLQRIEELLPQYATQKIDSADLNEEKSRLYDLRNNLGTILATLKNSLCLDVRERQFGESARRLVATIRALKLSKQA
jgi:hypothetical protein